VKTPVRERMPSETNITVTDALVEEHPLTVMVKFTAEPDDLLLMGLSDPGERLQTICSFYSWRVEALKLVLSSSGRLGHVSVTDLSGIGAAIVHCDDAEMFAEMCSEDGDLGMFPGILIVPDGPNPAFSIPGIAVAASGERKSPKR